MTTSIRKNLFAFFMRKSVINVQGDINFNIALRLHVRSGINNKRFLKSAVIPLLKPLMFSLVAAI